MLLATIYREEEGWEKARKVASLEEGLKLISGKDWNNDEEDA